MAVEGGPTARRPGGHPTSVSNLRTFVAPNPGSFTLDGTRTYVVGRTRPAVIDPGPDAESHLKRLWDEVSDAAAPTILLTHGHSDHAGGAEVLSRYLDAPIRGAGPGAESLDPGDSVETDAGELVAVATPGHASPHLSFHWLEEDALFVGDLLLGQGRTTWVGGYPGCVSDYLESLDRVEALSPRILYPGHGPPVFDVSMAVDRYRSHRLRRLDQLRGLRRTTPEASPEDLARKLYGHLEGEGLHKAGIESVRAMLHHLDTKDGGW